MKFHPNRTESIAAALVLIVGLAIIPAESWAKGAPVTKLITGSIEECGGGPADTMVRTFVVTLRERPSGRVIAIDTIKPSVKTGYYAFRVVPGTYYLATNAKTSPPPRGNVAIQATSPEVTELPITTTCPRATA